MIVNRRLVGPLRRRRGIAATELALIVPVLCFFFVIGIDYARIFYFSLTVTNCARNAAIYGSSNPTAAVDTSGIQTMAKKDAGNLNLQQLTVSSSTNNSANPTTVTVSVSYPFNTITRYPGVPSQTTITRTVQMNVAPWTPN